MRAASAGLHGAVQLGMQLELALDKEERSAAFGEIRVR